MTEEYIFTFGQRALVVALHLAGPILGFSLIVGILVSVFQAVTQIQDITLSFVPKILSVALAVVIFGPWMFRVLVSFTYNIFVNLPMLVR